MPDLGDTKQGYSLWNPFPMRWSLADGRLHLDGMRLLGQGTDIAIDGIIPFSLIGADRQQAGRRGRGRFQHVGARELSLRHRSQRRLQRRGGYPRHDAIAPVTRARCNLRNASLRSDEMPLGLSDMSGTLTFNGRRVRIDELKATSGGGTVRLTRHRGVRGRLDVLPPQRRGRAGARALPDQYDSTVNGQLTFSGNDLQSLLTGEIIVQRPDDFARRESRQPDLFARRAAADAGRRAAS